MTFLLLQNKVYFLSSTEINKAVKIYFMMNENLIEVEKTSNQENKLQNHSTNDVINMKRIISYSFTITKLK